MVGWGVADADILSLDPRIRNYVLIPISIIVLMQVSWRDFHRTLFIYFLGSSAPLYQCNPAG